MVQEKSPIKPGVRIKPQIIMMQPDLFGLCKLQLCSHGAYALQSALFHPIVVSFFRSFLPRKDAAGLVPCAFNVLELAIDPISI